MTTFLADGNVIVAGHAHHDVAIGWGGNDEPGLATCPITEGTLLRFLICEGTAASDAAAVLEAMRDQPWHEFWPDSLPFERSQLVGVIGHRQVTDAHLVALARHHGGRVVTLDRGLASLHGADVELLPT